MHSNYNHMPTDSNFHAVTMRKPEMLNSSMEAIGMESEGIRDLVTCDHKHHQDCWKLPGVGGFAATHNLLDLFSKYRDLFLVQSMSGGEISSMRSLASWVTSSSARTRVGIFMGFDLANLLGPANAWYATSSTLLDRACIRVRHIGDLLIVGHPVGRGERFTQVRGSWVL